MRVFIEVYEDTSESPLSDKSITKALNARLIYLQKRRAKISDVKVSMCIDSKGTVFRTYLITYVAKEQISIPVDV